MSAGDYDVGYGKPPIHTRFKPGEIRPRRSQKSKGTDVCAFFDEKVSVTVTGTQRQVHSFEVALTNLANKAIGGDMRAARRFMALCEDAGLLVRQSDENGWPSILRIPVDYDEEEWHDNLAKYGPPPWPLEHDGMPRLQEYRDGIR